MKTRLFALFAASLLALVPAVSAKPDMAAERTAAAQLLSFGRIVDTPTQSAESTPASAADLLGQHRKRLLQDASLQQAVAAKAFADAFGRSGSNQDLGTVKLGTTYTELLEQHTRWLAEHPDEYKQVIERAYRLVINRAAFDIEFDYWKQRPALPFSLLVGCIEDWGRRNAPGLMATTGIPTISINSRYLTTVRLSPTIAAEIRAASGLTPKTDLALAIAAGRNLIAAGGAELVTSGHMHFAAAGGPELLVTAHTN